MRAVTGALAGLAVVAGGLAAQPSSAQAGATVRIDSVRVIHADTRRPAKPPYRRARAYAYTVRYRIAGAALVRVRRRAEVRTANGVLIARVAPPATFDEPGRYFATSRIPVGTRDPRGRYVLVYTIDVSGGGGRGHTSRRVVLPFTR